MAIANAPPAQRRATSENAEPQSAGGLAIGVATTIVSWLGGKDLDSAVVRGMVAMGVRAEKDLTNLLFWAQHPAAAFRPIRSDEQDLAQAWIRIRDTVVRPALRAAEPSKKAGGGTAGGGALPGGGGVGPENLGDFGGEEATEFRKEVLTRQREWSSKRHEFFPGIPPADLEVVEGRHRLHESAAGDARALFAAARADLTAEQGRGDELAKKVVSIGISSAYRDPKSDFRAWQNAFRTHYGNTAAKRAKLPGGPHGEAAIGLMFTIMKAKKAPPGFSNHTHGLAIDFNTTQGKWTLGASSAQAAGWPNTWLWKWLVRNAASHNFHPYSAEAWHWDHRT